MTLFRSARDAVILTGCLGLFSVLANAAMSSPEEQEFAELQRRDVAAARDAGAKVEAPPGPSTLPLGDPSRAAEARVDVRLAPGRQR